MCGIAGLVSRSGELVHRDQVHSMCQTIVHRGPDDEGIYARGPVGLGMRRLSIIDLSGGRQPIHNEDQSVWVVFNGEIYNYLELRQELESRGHAFYTHSDTEVIVHLYEEMGAECFTKLRGMFAIALYDERKKSLLLGRDRLGKKPLFYAEHEGRLYFGSEIKTILAVAPELAEVDPRGVLDFFYFGYIMDPLSSFEKIRKLPAAHWIEFKNGSLGTAQPYWDVPAYGTYKPANEAECLRELESCLEEAVRIRLIADVPLGALLSGGVDSSIVVALMARLSSSPVKTFSIGFNNERFSEAEHARKVAQKFATDHHELVVEADIEQTIHYLTSMLEEPFGDSSMIPTYHVSRMARQHVTVALSGDGGDELFAGYDRYAVGMNRLKFDQVPRWLGRAYRNHIHPLVPPGTYGRNLLWNSSLPAGSRYLDSLSYLPGLDRERGLFSPEFAEAAAKLPNPLEQGTAWHDRGPAHDPLSRMQYLDTKSYLNGDILVKVDRMSMATSLEMRSPMLDHKFVEFAASLSPDWKFRAGSRKYILKKLAERLGVPPEVIYRKKQGFALPLEDWMRQGLKNDLLDILVEPRTTQRGYFRPAAVRRMVEEHTMGRRTHTGALWCLLMFELWHRNFLEARGYNPQPAGMPFICPSENPAPSAARERVESQPVAGGRI
jgi:asparagine synthase (glutamine-hydrolysing)